jgi:ribonuclease I
MCEQAYDGDVEMHGLWPQWQNAHDNKDYTTASALALQIANLPERIDMAEVEEFLEREG